MGDRQTSVQDQTSPATAAEADTLEFSQIIRPQPGVDRMEFESSSTVAPRIAPGYGRGPDTEAPSAAVVYAARIAVVLGVSLVLGPMGYTAGLILRDRPGHQARPQTAHAVTVQVTRDSSVTVPAAAPTSPPPPTTALVELATVSAVAAAPSDAVLASVAATPMEVRDDAGNAAATMSTLAGSGPNVASQTQTPRATSGIFASPRELPRHPSIAAFLQAQSTLAKRFATCNVHLGHHAYVHVRYDGVTGQPSRVEFVGHTLDGNPLTACLEPEVRAVNLTPFRDAQWEAHYIVMIR